MTRVDWRDVPADGGIQMVRGVNLRVRRGLLFGNDPLTATFDSTTKVTTPMRNASIY